ncbi:MAG: ubiquilin-like protein [Amphiamblys sp. WSBS2006]|nr:MAG: ubiquilin-like protein [Amphiamblys sp. WSBS2006]
MTSLLVKHRQQVFSLDLDLVSATLADLKELLWQKTKIPHHSQNMVYRGKILRKDTKPLVEYGITEGGKVYLSQLPAANPLEQEVYEDMPAAFRSPEKTLEDAQKERKMLAEARRGMKKSMLRALKENPEMMLQLMAVPPEMEEMLDRNPEMRDIMEDPAMMEQMLDAMDNPEIEKEVNRNSDLAMNNIEAMPNGLNILRQAYETTVTPGFSALRTKDDQPEEDEPRRRGEPAAIPNPWRKKEHVLLGENSSFSESEERDLGLYQPELETLLEMGFSDEKEARRALEESGGNVTKATSILLGKKREK